MHTKRLTSDIRKLIKPYLKTGRLVLEHGKRHVKIRNPVSGDWVPLPGTPGDWRALTNLKGDLRRLAERGEGLIYAKTGHLPALA